MARLRSGSSRSYSGRPVFHARCCFPGETIGWGYRYPNVPASLGRAFARRRDTKQRKADKEKTSSALRGNLHGEKAGVSRGHSRRGTPSQMA